MAPRAEKEELTGQWRPLWVTAGDGGTEQQLRCVDCHEITDQRESDWSGGRGHAGSRPSLYLSGNHTDVQQGPAEAKHSQSVFDVHVGTVLSGF